MKTVNTSEIEKRRSWLDLENESWGKKLFRLRLRVISVNPTP
jgi:hypothetical protein